MPAQELHGDALAVLVVGALGDVHRAHAAAADLPDDPVRADARALPGLFPLRQADQRVHGAGRSAREDGLRARERLHQPLHGRPQLRICRAALAQIDIAGSAGSSTSTASSSG